MCSQDSKNCLPCYFLREICWKQKFTIWQRRQHRITRLLLLSSFLRSLFYPYFCINTVPSLSWPGLQTTTRQERGYPANRKKDVTGSRPAMFERRRESKKLDMKLMKSEFEGRISTHFSALRPKKASKFDTASQLARALWEWMVKTRQEFHFFFSLSLLSIRKEEKRFRPI